MTKTIRQDVKEKISVCVATYNQRNYISDCLLSVLMQSSDVDLEILIGNDCSTDNTGELVREISTAFPGRLTIPIRERNLGPSRNYQDLISRASGDYIACLDGDDYWMPGKLAAQLDFLRAHPDCAAVYTDAHVISENGELIGTFNDSPPFLFDTDYLLRRGNFLNFSSILFRATLKRHILAIDSDFIDYRVHLLLSCHGKLGYISRDLVAYRTGVATSMLKTAQDGIIALYWDALRDVDVGGRHVASVIRGKANHFAFVFCLYILKRRPANALKLALQVARENQAYWIFLGAGLQILVLIPRLLLREARRFLGGQRLRILFPK